MLSNNNIIAHFLAFVKKELYKFMKKELFYVPADTSWTAFSNELTENYGLIVSGVYAKLLDLCPKGETTVTVRQTWLAKKLHLSVRTVRDALKELEEIGLVAETRRSRASTYEIKPIINIKGHLQLPEKPQTPPSHKRRKERPMSQKEIEKMEAYMSVVNRFPEDNSEEKDSPEDNY